MAKSATGSKLVSKAWRVAHGILVANASMKRAARPEISWGENRDTRKSFVVGISRVLYYDRVSDGVQPGNFFRGRDGGICHWSIGSGGKPTIDRQ